MRGPLLLPAAVAVLLWMLVLPAVALDPFPSAGSSVPPPVSWIDDLRNELGRYMWAHPNVPLAPYLETLTVVRESVSRGDRRTVKLEMETYFRMLVMQSRGITDAAAKELSSAAIRLTPAQMYGISIPASLRR